MFIPILFVILSTGPGPKEVETGFIRAQTVKTEKQCRAILTKLGKELEANKDVILYDSACIDTSKEPKKDPKDQKDLKDPAVPKEATGEYST